MIEVHPFGEYVPEGARYLLLGSFTTKPNPGYEWFYANGRNQFWPIWERVYGVTLTTKRQQQGIFEKLNMALADIILSCERLNNSNLDNKLVNIVFNRGGVSRIFNENRIERVYFTSRWVEARFKQQWREIAESFEKKDLVYLPSPSPRNARMSLEEKIKRYRECLPRLG